MFTAALPIIAKMGNNAYVYQLVKGQQNLVYSYNGILLINKKEQNTK